MPLSAGEAPGTGSRQGCPSDHWVCLCATSQETSEILISLTLMGGFLSCLQWLICGHQYGAWLKLPVLKQTQEEVCYRLYRGGGGGGVVVPE